jgi:flavocytochrome c
MEDKKKNGFFSRRDLLKGLGVGGGAIFLGRIGIAEAALLPKAAKSERTNAVVIGTGLAGLTAALEARLGGAEVLILEKVENGKDGGNSKLAGGAITVPTENSKKAIDVYFEELMKKNMGRGNIELTRVIADQIYNATDWLQSHGVSLLAPVDMPPYRVKSFTVGPGQFMGMPAALGKLKDKFLKEGGKIVYRTKAKQLIMDGKGRVAGVRALGPGGLVDIMADVVILATGGYAGNKEFLETFIDPNADEMMVRGVPWETGDGFYLAREAGAMLVNMGGMTSVHVAAVSTANPAAGNPSRAVPFCLGINREGNRYVDESKGYVAHGKAALKQPGQTVALIFDEELKAKEGVQISLGTFKRQGIKVLESDTLEGLAEQIGVPPAKLVQTVNDFNNSVKDGKAMEAKPAKTAVAFKIMTPPFYAFYPLVPGITLTFGGIRVNTKGQALEADGTPIEGLYAAGECAGGVYYDDYIAGGSLANCLVMGRAAGKEAAGRKTALKKGKPA